MNFSFKHLKDNVPAKCERSMRLRKKLHVDEFQETLFEFKFFHELTSSDMDEFSTEIDLVIDYVFEQGPNSFVGMSCATGTLVMLSSTEKFSSTAEKEQYAMQTANKVLHEITKIWSVYATVQDVHVIIGDTYYGEW